MFTQQRWRRKFQCAFRGIGFAVRSQDSFRVHIPAGIAVFLLASFGPLSAIQWTICIACIGAVIAAELFNCAIETLAHHLHPQQHPQIGIALDMAAAAVLVTAITAAAIGSYTFFTATVNWLMRHH